MDTDLFWTLWYSISWTKKSKLKKKHLILLDKKNPSKIFQKKPKVIQKAFAKKNKASQERCKIDKTLFETLKKNSKKPYYSNLIVKYKNNIKKIWDVMKEIIGKYKFRIRKLPHKIVIDGKQIINEKTIAEKFNNFL